MTNRRMEKAKPLSGYTQKKTVYDLRKGHIDRRDEAAGQVRIAKWNFGSVKTLQESNGCTAQEQHGHMCCINVSWWNGSSYIVQGSWGVRAGGAT
jgi:hypothetical protein